MNKIQEQALLENQDVIDEINRHLWIESEKAGYDIGFEHAARDWLENYAQDWISYHMPSHKKPKNNHKPAAKPKASAARKRSAKTYL